ELVPAINALASARAAGIGQADRIAALDGALERAQRHAETTLRQMQERLSREAEAHAQMAEAHARERAAHGETRARLAYRESARGWVSFPLSAAARAHGAEA